MNQESHCVSPTSPGTGSLSPFEWVLVAAALSGAFLAGTLFWFIVDTGPFWGRGRSIPEDFVLMGYGITTAVLTGSLLTFPTLIPIRLLLLGGCGRLMWIWSMRLLLVLVVMAVLLEPFGALLRIVGLGALLFGEEAIWFRSSGMSGVGLLLLFLMYVWFANRMVSLPVLRWTVRAAASGVHPGFSRIAGGGSCLVAAFLLGLLMLALSWAAAVWSLLMLVLLPFLTMLGYFIVRQFFSGEDQLLQGASFRATGGTG